MSQESDKLTPIVSPFEVAEMLQLSVRRCADNSRVLMTDCPSCGAILTITVDGFFCQNKECRFTVGSVLDISALCLGGYTKAVTALMQCFRDRLINVMDMDESTTSSIIERGRKKRRFLDFILQSFRRPMTAEGAGVRSKLNKFKIGECVDRTFAFVSQQDSQTLAELMLDYCPGADVGWLRKKNYAVMPYWSNYHTVSALMWFDGENYKTTDLHPYNVAMSGLLQGGPLTRHLFTHRDWRDACRANECWSSSDTSRLSVGLRKNNYLPPEISPCWPTVTYVMGEADVTAWLPSRLASSMPSMTVAGSIREQPKPWLDFFADLLVSHVRSDGRLDFTGQAILSSASPNGGDRMELTRKLRERGELAMADQINKSLYSAEIFRHGKQTLTESPTGYRYAKDGQIGDLISNFMLRVDGTVAFQDSRDVFHSCSILSGDSSVPILLDSRVLDDVKAMQGVLQSASAAARSTSVPVISDHSGWKLVAEYLRRLTTRLDVTQGISHLGWDFRKQKFSTPTWTYGKDGAQVSGRMHPSIDILDCWEADRSERTDYILEGLIEAIPADVMHCCSLVLGSVMRGFGDSSCRVCSVRADRNTENWMRSIFAALGQARILPRIERDMGGYLRGIPALAHAADKMTMTVKAPYFVLTEFGFQINSPFSTQAGHAVTTLCGAMIRRTVEHLLASVDPPHTERLVRLTYDQEVRDSFGLFARAELTVPWPEFIPEHEAVHQMLSSMTPVSIAGSIKYDFSQQQLCIDTSSIPEGVNAADLAMQLRKLCRFCEVDKSTIKVDAFTGMNVLDHFYGDHVVIPQLATV